MCLASTGDNAHPSVTVQQLHGAVDEVVLQRPRSRSSFAVQQLGGVVDGAEVRGPVLLSFLPIRRLAAVDLVFFRRASREYTHVLSVPVTTTAHAGAAPREAPASCSASVPPTPFDQVQAMQNTHRSGCVGIMLLISSLCLVHLPWAFAAWCERDCRDGTERFQCKSSPPTSDDDAEAIELPL